MVSSHSASHAARPGEAEAAGAGDAAEDGEAAGAAGCGGGAAAWHAASERRPKPAAPRKARRLRLVWSASFTGPVLSHDVLKELAGGIPLGNRGLPLEVQVVRAEGDREGGVLHRDVGAAAVLAVRLGPGELAFF